MSLGIPRLVDELKTIAVEVGDVGGVVAGGKVGAMSRFAFIGAAGFDRSSIRSIYLSVGVADNPEVEPGFAALALTQPDARSNRLATAVRVITDAVKIGDALRARSGVVVADSASGLLCRKPVTSRCP